MIKNNLSKVVVFFAVLGGLFFSTSCESELHRAASRGDIKAVTKLIKEGKNVNSKNIVSGTPLLVAIRSKHADVVEKLIGAGADVNVEGFDHHTNNSKTALMFAVRNEQTDIVEKLIVAGAKVNEQNRNTGETALILAACLGNAKIAKKLIDAGADINAATFYNKYKVLDYAIASGNKELIKMLEEKGAVRGRSVVSNPKQIFYKDINGGYVM